MADAKSRARVERLLRGDFRPDDLTGLFLYARDHCDGREPVAEIGHFVAHHHERDKGIVTRFTREWFAIARFHMARFGGAEPQQFHARALPPATYEYFKIAANRIDPKIIRNRTGLRRADAQKKMINVADRLAANVDGTWALPTDLTKEEITLVECVISYLVVKPAFEADRLCDDFIATLRSNGLVKKEEVAKHEVALRLLVQLYAVAAMHNCVVQIGDGTTTQLRARAEMSSKTINVNAAVPDAVPNKPHVLLSSSMFSANVDPAIHCHPDLTAGGEWNFEIELAQDKRLTPLR